MDLTKVERRKDPTSQLLRAVQEQNVLLQDILSVIRPVTDFVKALHLVVKVAAALAAGLGVLWGLWQTAKEYIKTHP